MSTHRIVTLITLILLAIVIFFGWDQITEACALLGSVNLKIFVLIVPLQAMSYFAVGEIMYSYLRSKSGLAKMNVWQMMRLSLESNFVDHIVPVPGAAGFSYVSWALRRFGVSVSRSTMAQIIRLVMVFMSFVALVLLSIIVLLFDGKTQPFTVIVALLFVALSVGATSFLIYVVNKKSRFVKISNFIANFVNKMVKKITMGKKVQILKEEKVEKVFSEIHQDYLSIKRDKKILLKPFAWAFLANMLDVSLFFIAFWSLGIVLNPAVLIIAFGLSSSVAIFAATPGGTGVYEAIMIAFLASSGVSAEVAIAGTLLARAILLVLTIAFGYVFYQLTINKYGKNSKRTHI